MRLTTALGLLSLLLLSALIFVPPAHADSPSPWDTSWLPTDPEALARIASAIDAIVVDPDQGSIGGTESGLRGTGQVILRYALSSIDGNPAGVNPAFALAMFREEANFARPDSLAHDLNNPGDLRCTGVYGDTDCQDDFAVFDSVQDGIKAYFWLLTREYKPGGKFGGNWGCTDITCVVEPYCPPSECDTYGYANLVAGWTSGFQAILSRAAFAPFGSSAVSPTVSRTFLPGQSGEVELRFKNTGSQTWRTGEISLTSSNSQALAPAASVAIQSETPPGGTATFRLQLTAPADTGAYADDWQLERPGKHFGDKATVTVTVSALPLPYQNVLDHLADWAARLIDSSPAQTGLAPNP